MQNQQKLDTRQVQQITTSSSHVSRSVSRVPGTYQYEATTTFRSDFDGDEIDHLGERAALLKWSILPEDQQQVIQGISDMNILNKFKNILLALRQEYGSDGHIFVKTDQRDSYNRRLLLLENQIEGLLKRKIQYSVKDQQGGHRVMDYTILLNQKQNQIIQLQKKINNLEERLRRSTARELELQNHIQQLNFDLKRKDEIIRAKNQQILAEVAASNLFRESLNRLRRNIDQNRTQIGPLERVILESITFPDQTGFEIRADALTKDGSVARSSNYSSAPLNTQYRTQMISLFRQFDRLNNAQGISAPDFERVLEGFLVSVPGSRFGDMTISTLESRKIKEDYMKLRQQFAVASQLYRSHIERIQRQNPGLRIDVDKNLLDLLSSERVSIDRIDGGVVFMERFLEKTIEVPVQDVRSKHLLHLFAVQLRRLSGKYPKLLSQMDVRLTEFFQQELIDVIEVDEIDRLVEIVKYVPQVVKVENVYAYSSEKSRKVEFHLRVLVKALLQQLQKLKLRTGAVLEMDEGVIGMINQQIMGIVDVDDILKVFRVVPKIVEVEKIIQKVVDRIVEVPQVVPIQKVVEKIVEVEKIKQVERVVNVPIQIPRVVNNIVQKIVPIQKIVQKIVQVPSVRERHIQLVRQVPKIVEVDRIVEKVVEKDRVIQVQRQVNHMVPQIRQVRVEVEKIIPVERVVQRIVQVPTFVERIVEKVVQVPQIVEVEKIVEKIVERVEYKVQKEMIPYVQVEHKIVQKIIQKPIPIIQRQERIVQVPQIVQKIVEVRTIQQQIKQIQVIRDRIVVQDRLKQIQKIVNVPVPLIQQVQKVVQRRIQIPVVHERVVKVPQIVTQTVIQKLIETKIVEVQINNPIIINEPKVIEVDKIINHYIDVPRPIKHIEEKIIQVPKVIERVKQVRVAVDKIIQKMVEVPKVVEVQKIVEKVVVVPRVIQKIVEIPQIVEVPVEKEIVREIIREVEKIIQIPVIQEKIVQVQTIKNIYIQVEKPIQILRDRVVDRPIYEEKVLTHDVIQQRVVEVVREVPRQIEVERIVTNYVDREHVVEIERPIVVPVQIPVPVERIIQKLVPVYETKQHIVQVPQIMEKIVEVRNDIVEVKEVQSFVRDVVVDTRIVEVPSERVVVQTQIRQVPTVVEKVVPVTHVVQQIVTAQQIVEKVVQKTNQIPKIYEVERIVEKLIEVPKIVQIQTLVPQLVRVNEFIQNIVQKIVQVPIIVERVKDIVRESEKIVQVQTEVPKIIEVQRLVEKTVVLEKFREAVKNINHIEQVLQVVDRFEQTPVPIHTKEQHLIEVPHILEKIVQKIVVMPQIVEVLKYVHEIVQTEDLGVAVGVDVMSHQQKYKLLARNIQTNFEVLITELNKLVRAHPALRSQIELILKFLAQLNQFIMFPKIVQVPHEKIVEKIVQVQKIVRVPTQDDNSIRMQVSLSLLVQKLITELKRIKIQNPNINLNLEEDVRLIFFTQFGAPSNIIAGNMADQLKLFSDSIQRKFESLGNWTLDHQLMLNSFLQERFIMANIVKNSNMEIEKAKAISEKRLQGIRRYKNDRQTYDRFSRQILDILPRMVVSIRSTREGSELANQIQPIMRDFNQFLQGQVSVIVNEPIRALDDLNVTDQRVLSLFREKDAEILKLRQKLLADASKFGTVNNQINQRTIHQLTVENNSLKRQISELQSRGITSDFSISNEAKNRSLNQDILRLQQENADLRSSLTNTRNDLLTKLNIAEAEIQQLNILLGKSRNQPRTATQFNQLSPQSRNFNSPTSGVVSILNSQSNHYGNGTNSNSPMTARFSTTTNDQISPATYSNRQNNYGISSTTLSASRGIGNTTVPASSLQSPGGYNTNFDVKGDIGGRQSYSTNQMSVSNSIGGGSIAIDQGLGMGSGVGVGGVAGMSSSSSYQTSSMQGASYGPGQISQSGTYYQQQVSRDNSGSVTTSRQGGFNTVGNAPNAGRTATFGVGGSGVSGFRSSTQSGAFNMGSPTNRGQAAFGNSSLSSNSGSAGFRGTYGRGSQQDSYQQQEQ